MPYQISVTEACVDESKKKNVIITSDKLYLHLRIANNNGNFPVTVKFRDPHNNNLASATVSLPPQGGLHNVVAELNFQDPIDVNDSQYHLAFILEDQDVWFNIRMDTLIITTKPAS